MEIFLFVPTSWQHYFPTQYYALKKIGNTYQIILCNIEDTSLKRNSSILYQNFRLPDTIFIDHDIDFFIYCARQNAEQVALKGNMLNQGAPQESV